MFEKQVAEQARECITGKRKALMMLMFLACSTNIIKWSCGAAYVLCPYLKRLALWLVKKVKGQHVHIEAKGFQVQHGPCQ